MIDTEGKTYRQIANEAEAACAVIIPAPYRNMNSTLVECALLGEDYAEERPRYAFRISEITEGGPVVIFEGDQEWGGKSWAIAWAEPEDMALSILDGCSIDPEDVGDGYGNHWTDEQREWNSSYGEGLQMIRYEMNAAQCGNACRTELIDGRHETVENHMLTDNQALQLVTKFHGLTWTMGGPIEEPGDAEALAALEAFWRTPAA